MSQISLVSVYAQSETELFRSVFGEVNYEAQLELILHGKSLGDISVKLQGSKLKYINSTVLNEKIKSIVKDKNYKLIDTSKKWASISTIPYQLKYDEKALQVVLDIPVENLKSVFYSLEENPKIKYAGQTIEAAPFAGSINYLLDKQIGDSYLGGDSLTLNINSFLNIKSYVVQMNGFYVDDEDSDKAYWTRRDLSLTKDFESLRLRTRLGDTTTGRLGFMQSKAIGGLNLRKQFLINPYDTPYTQGEKEFQIVRRSNVSTYVNGTLVKKAILPAGNYRLSNLPLVNGINNVRLEIDDGSGVKQLLEFNIPTSLSILKRGEFDYSLSAGRKSDDSGRTRRYIDNNDFFSGLIQYGFTDQFSAGAYYQKDDQFQLSGLYNGVATEYGNFFLGNAYSDYRNLNVSGFANSLTWQFQDIGGYLLENLSLTARYELFDGDFRATADYSSFSLKNNYQINLSFPFLSRSSINLGAGHGEYQDSKNGHRNFLRASVNINPMNNLNINLYAARTKDLNNPTNHSVSAFVTWSFPNHNSYISMFRDFENKSNRISYTKDNSNELYKPRYTVSVDEDKINSRLNFNASMPTPMADYFFKAAYAHEKGGDDYNQVGFGISTTSLFAYDDGFAYAQSRSNTNSFALFKTTDSLKNQKLIIKSTSVHADTQTPLFGELAITDMVPYQYREVQLDPTALNYGTTLEKEKFVLYPTYQSGHLINISDNGLFSLKGRLVRNGKPVALEICQLGDKVFFTDREGSFFVDGIDYNASLLKVSGKEVKYISIAKDSLGIIDIGLIEIEGK
ncbi:fimbria/pilus outer membrane usher protein [Bacteriovorax sp. BAL6_X]|uniref:fimbria/pilus outer membrane usher protein n=1 Tax=Bacteriovorax sp. BAL6_X TaxID=1201290 RepID=UPI0012EEC588|nr:fimbria/pilus outer membrane usher protein [Bacteriovorax sp. BAL6_X]